MSEHNRSKTETTSFSFTDKLIERKGIRWMLVFYDTILYFACWFAFFSLSPSVDGGVPKGTQILYYVIGYVFFFCFRFIFRSYRRILRTGNIGAFARELASVFLGVLSLCATALLFNKVLHIAGAPLTTVLSFASFYALVSILVRILYCYLYAFATKENTISRVVRKILEVFTFVDFSSNKPGAVLKLVLEPDRTVSGPINELQNIIDHFAIRGDITGITQINKGYINRTYRIETLSDTGHVHKYTLQRINTNVFPDVDSLMENFKKTTTRLYGRFFLSGCHENGSVPMLRSTKDGRSYYRDDSGCWRMLTFFDDVYSLDIPDRPETFYHAGVAFGSFTKEMAGIDIGEYIEVIPNFHNTKSRYQDLEKAIEKDPKGRVKQVMKEIRFIRDRADKFGLISSALESGKIPTRICHNDCNLNNILFDNETHLPVAIIDLDTVMPSSPLYDFGDSMRIGTNTAKDDEKDLSKVSCDLGLYEQYARGFLEACGDVLTKEELELLPYASLVITSEDGIRFLMDHINGDTYYNIYYPGQNLDRARTQLKLVEDMERKLPEIKDILRKIYAKFSLDASIE